MKNSRSVTITLHTTAKTCTLLCVLFRANLISTDEYLALVKQYNVLEGVGKL